MSLDTLALAARAALLAYPSQRDHVGLPDNCSLTTLDDGDLQAVLLHFPWDGLNIIGIAGTNEPNDWRANLNLGTARAYARSVVEVHQGYFLTATQLYQQLLARNFRHTIGKNHTILAGHSLGGPVAGCLPLCGDDFPFPEIITFGAPRFLRRETAGIYGFGGRTLRVVRPRDLVPDLPLYRHYRWLPTPVMGWSHTGSILWLNDDGSRETEQEANFEYWRWAKRLWQYATTRPSLIDELINREHDMRDYHRLIEIKSRSEDR